MADQFSPAQLRGIDPTWRELDFVFATILLRSSCEDVIAALKKEKKVTGQVRDLRSEDVAIGDWGMALFVFQLVGHEWTQISGADWWLINPELAARLSKRLQTTAIQHFGEGVYQGFEAHILFETGKEVESAAESEDVATELGAYITSGVWGDADGRVACMKEGWGMSAFQCARLLTLKS